MKLMKFTVSNLDSQIENKFYSVIDNALQVIADESSKITDIAIATARINRLRRQAGLGRDILQYASMAEYLQAEETRMSQDGTFEDQVIVEFPLTEGTGEQDGGNNQ